MDIFVSWQKICTNSLAWDVKGSIVRKTLEVFSSSPSIVANEYWKCVLQRVDYSPSYVWMFKSILYSHYLRCLGCLDAGRQGCWQTAYRLILWEPSSANRILLCQGGAACTQWLFNESGSFFFSFTMWTIMKGHAPLGIRWGHATTESQFNLPIYSFYFSLSHR